MTSLTLLSPTGEPLATLTLPPGESVMQAALRANINGIEAECGGCLSCATCHVYVRGAVGNLSDPADEEINMLDFVAAERLESSRLSCQLFGSDALKELVVGLPCRQVA